MNLPQELYPRLFTDKSASLVSGFSVSWYRNTRYDDERRVDEGLEPKGPPWVKIGRNVRYPVPEHTEWLELVISGNHPAWETEFHSDTSGLKYSGIDKRKTGT